MVEEGKGEKLELAERLYAPHTGGRGQLYERKVQVLNLHFVRLKLSMSGFQTQYLGNLELTALPFISDHLGPR